LSTFFYFFEIKNPAKAGLTPAVSTLTSLLIAMCSELFTDGSSIKIKNKKQIESKSQLLSPQFAELNTYKVTKLILSCQEKN